VAALESDNGISDRPVPTKARIAVARRDRQPRHLGRMKARAMQVELRGAETISPAVRAPDEFGTQHGMVERVRALPVGDMHHAMVEANRKRHPHRSMRYASSHKAPPGASHAHFRTFARRMSYAAMARQRRAHRSEPQR